MLSRLLEDDCEISNSWRAETESEVCKGFRLGFAKEHGVIRRFYLVNDSAALSGQPKMAVEREIMDLETKAVGWVWGTAFNTLNLSIPFCKGLCRIVNVVCD